MPARKEEVDIKIKGLASDGSSGITSAQSPGEDLTARWQSVVRRRSFLKSIGIGGAVTLGAQLGRAQGTTLSAGDAAVLRFLAAVETIETDLWGQYNELGGVNGGNPAYMAALKNIDADMPQYIADNTDDEMTHAAFLNAYLMSRGAMPVNLERVPRSSTPSFRSR